MPATAPSSKKRSVRGRVLACAGALLLVAAGFGMGWYVRGLGASAGAGYSVASTMTSSTQAGEAQSLGSRVEEAANKLSIESYTPVDTDTATTAAISALVKCNGDVYGKYFTAQQYASYLEQSNGEFGGLGMLLSEYNGRAYVVRVYPNTPAEAAGLQEGDFITSIDGDARVSWSVEEVVGTLPNDPGTTVKLGWRRPANKDDMGGEQFEASIEVSTVEIPNVEYSLVGDVGYISIAQFTRKSTDKVSEAISALGAQGAKGYVIDVRDNPGGYVAQAVETASMFLKPATVVQVQSRNSGLTKTQSTGKPLTDKPVTVIVNGNSASAAEIFAAALKDNGRANVIGVTTFGKGSLQTIAQLSFGGAIKYTIAYYLSPNGDTIDGVGVQPTTVVEMDSSLRGSGDTDTQYLAAIADCDAQIAALAAQGSTTASAQAGSSTSASTSQAADATASAAGAAIEPVSSSSAL